MAEQRRDVRQVNVRIAATTAEALELAAQALDTTVTALLRGAAETLVAELSERDDVRERVREIEAERAEAIRRHFDGG